MERKRQHFWLWSLYVVVWAIFWYWPQDANAYEIFNRWSGTQTDGYGLRRGDPVTLLWSIVPDGRVYSRATDSQLVGFLDDGWNVPELDRTPDFTNRPWWLVINNAYAQYARVSGIAFQYVAEQTDTGENTGKIGDIRIGGENIDGNPAGALADSTFPDLSDIRIDITRKADKSVPHYFTSEAAFRNLIMHETGHGVGLNHVTFVNNSGKALMEARLRTDIWGLQFDDIYALNRQYGDPCERNGGNDTWATATPLGSFTTSGSISVGTDAVNSVNGQFDDDWVGIDGETDADWFEFSVTGESFANIKLTPVGPTYAQVQQGEVRAAEMSNLVLQFFTANPVPNFKTEVDQYGLGGVETIGAELLPTGGDYMIRVQGTEDLNQFYRLDLTITELPIAGTSADLNLDGQTTMDDWELFVANQYVDLSGLNQRDAFGRGDLDLDGDNDIFDFGYFKTAYNAANGPGAFESLLTVPEPRTLLLVCVVGCGWFARSRIRMTKVFGRLIMS